NNLGGAKQLSENIRKSILELERKILEYDGVGVIIAGGDDLLLEYDPSVCPSDLIESIPRDFEKKTGISMSFGIGTSISSSMENLNFSKRSSLQNSTSARGEDTRIKKDDDAVLIIFSDSLSPDPYINVIAHWYARSRLRKVSLLKIEKDIGKIRIATAELEQLKERIFLQIKLLSKSKYLRKKRGTQNDWEEVEVQLSENEKDFYRILDGGISSVLFDEIVYDYAEIAHQLPIYISANRKSFVQSIFDISTVKKELIVDIYVILSMEGISNINTFQLIPKPTYSEKDLLHCLRFDEQYKYPSVANSNFTADKTVAFSKDLSNAIDYHGRNSSLQETLRKQETSIKQLKMQVADVFASFCMTMILFVFVLPVCSIVAVLAFRDWDDGFEKYTFIVPVICLFVASFIFQAIFRMNFSLNPQSIRKAIKDWKLKELEKSKSQRV
ncbi:MAG: hypothetical protein AAFY72_07325, partial [Cyanobacteria bacterium J06649_4]